MACSGRDPPERMSYAWWYNPVFFFGDRNFNPASVHFSLLSRTKRFFVYTHESPANQKYRKEQTARYLKRERLMHRWYQMSLEEALVLEKKRFTITWKGIQVSE
jgi:hypothetical protein